MRGAFRSRRKVTAMAWNQHGSATRRTVSKAETKNCPLCNTLNFHRNVECLACGWRGAFDRDAAVIDFHWQRLTERYEEVRLENLLPKKTRRIGEFGIARKPSLMQQIREVWAQSCRALQARRPARPIAPGPNSVLPPK